MKKDKTNKDTVANVFMYYTVKESYYAYTFAMLCNPLYEKHLLPSMMSKSFAASSDPLLLNCTSPLSVTIMVRSAMSTKQPTTSPLCQEHPSGSVP